MALFFSPRERAERLIAGGRIVLAATSLAALWRDPTEPAKYAEIAYALLAAYLLYATAIAVVVWRWPAARERQALPTHCFDLAFFAAFMYFTSGPASPFIAYFVFSLVCAALRWQWRGTLWTAVAALGVYSTLGYYFAAVLADPSFEANRFVIRGVYMAVVAFLLGQLGRHEERTRREMAALANWPSRGSGSLEEAVADTLLDTATLLDTPRAALEWQSPERGRHLVIRRGGEIERRPAGELDERFASLDLERDSVLVPARERGGGGVLARRDGELRRFEDGALVGALRGLLGDGDLLSAPWRGELSSGRLFVAGVAEATSDDLILVEIAAALAGARLDAQLLLDRRREAAATEERVRLSRDLHDGVLQSLTAIGLRVAAARRLLPDDAAAAERGLAELGRLLAVEQRDLRFLIHDLEPSAVGTNEPDLGARLAELVHRVEQEWQLTVELAVEELDDEELDEATERDLYFLIREALVNAVRHGEARSVRIALRRPSPGRAEVVVEDDGRGFPFEGRREMEELAAQQSGPRSLRERVAARGGRLTLESSSEGARLEIEVPT